MKKLLIFLSLLGVLGVSAAEKRVLRLIPQPVKAELNVGVFVTEGCRVTAEGFATPPEALLAAAEGLSRPCGDASVWRGANTVTLRLDPACGTPAEGYRLSVTPRQVLLTAADESGVFYGLQTLLQMADSRGNIPCAEIGDHPRFGYRGVHLDVCRHFFPMAFVKEYLDRMASCKLNTLHWHLTDDQGWRIEIRRYPRLTEVGGFRDKTQIGDFNEKPITYETGRYGGFYTQDEIREIVAYAAARHITVIPEIEMPGHALAALAAYPELGCRKDETYRTGGHWGVFEEVFCPGKETTFTFLQNVLDEVMELFPSKCIHIGGDECPKVRWKVCPDCQARIKSEGLKDETQLQSYFTRRMGDYLASKGRRLIGWDEILEGGIAPDAIVMSWRGTKGGVAAAKQKHQVIMTPSTYLYFDKRATTSPEEPMSLSSSTLPMEKIYGYDPLAELNPEEGQYILGVQANLWAEFIKTPQRVSFQLLPRIYALAEIAWSPVERKSWPDFSEVRLPAFLSRLDAEGTVYSVPTPLGITGQTLEGDRFRFTLRPPFEGCKVYYTLNGAIPYDFDREIPQNLDLEVPPGEQRILKCVAVTPSGRRSIVVTTVMIHKKQTTNQTE